MLDLQHPKEGIYNTYHMTRQIIKSENGTLPLQQWVGFSKRLSNKNFMTQHFFYDVTMDHFASKYRDVTLKNDI